MKHNADTKQQQNVKQNLLCESDETGILIYFKKFFKNKFFLLKKK